MRKTLHYTRYNWVIALCPLGSRWTRKKKHVAIASQNMIVHLKEADEIMEVARG